MAPSLLCCLLVSTAPPDRPAPLTPDQIANLQIVVRRTQDRNNEIKTALNERQQELMKAYSLFALNESHITELHKEIVDLQRELLKNYRDLQVELRETVGEQRFTQLKKRIDLILKGKNQVQAKPGASPEDGASKRRSGAATSAQ